MKIMRLQGLVFLGLINRDIDCPETALSLLENAATKLHDTPSLDAGCPGRFESVLCNLVAISVDQSDLTGLEAYCGALQKQFVDRDDALRRGMDKAEVAEILRHLGRAFRNMGRFDLAEHYYLESLKEASETTSVPLSHKMGMQIVSVRNDLAVFYGDVGRHDKAHIQFIEAFELAKCIFPTTSFPHGHVILAALTQNLAMHNWLIGETDKAAELYRKAVAMNEAIFSEDDYPKGHRRLQESYSAWANVLTREKRFEEAISYASKANEMILNRCTAATSWTGNDDLAASWIDLGRIKRARGEYAAAEELFSRALLSYESRGRGEQASGRMSIALALAELGRTHAAAEDFSTALDYHRRSLAIRQELFPLASFPLGHPRLANAWRDLGLTHLDAGEPDEAFRALAQSVAMEHAIGESFFGSGSEAQVLNFAAPQVPVAGAPAAGLATDGLARGRSLSVCLEAARIGRPDYRRPSPANAHIGSQEPTRRLPQIPCCTAGSLRALLVSVADDGGNDSERRVWLERLNTVKEELEHELARSLPTNESELPAAAEIQTLAATLPHTVAFVDYFSYVAAPFDATVPTREIRIPPNAWRHLWSATAGP